MKTLLLRIATRLNRPGRTAAAALLGLALLSARARAAVPDSMELWVYVPPSVSLLADATIAASTATIGQPVMVFLTVSNAGAGAAAAVTAGLWQASGSGAATISAPNPASVASLNPGGTAQFTFTVTGTVAGTVCWTGTATSGGGSGSTPVPPVCTLMQTPPSLTSVVSVAPSAVCTGQPFDVTVTMANAGQATATGVTVLPFTLTGTGTASLAASPASLAVTLAGGASTTYVWTYNTVAAGGIGFALTATGTDQNSGLTVAGPRRVSPTILASTSASLFVQTLVQPNVSLGQTFTVQLSVTNAGGVAANATGAALYITSGPGSIVSASAAPAAIAGGGGTHVYSWTVSVSGTGAVTFTATAAGTACGSFGVGAADSAATNVLTAPNLVSGITVSPTTFVQGQVITVVMTVTNTGGSPMTGVIPSIVPTGPVTSPGTPTLANGTPLSGTGTVLSGPGVITFTWTFTSTGAGTVTFAGGVSGTDPNTGGSVASPPAATPPPVVVESPAGIAASLGLTPLLQVQVGGTATAALSIANTGESLLRIDSIVKTELDPGGLFGAPTAVVPALPFTIQGSGTTVFTWTYNAAFCGSAPFQLSANVLGTDLGLSRTVAAGPVAANALTVATAPATMVVSVLDPRVKVAGLANITVTVYDSCTPAVAVANEVITLSVITGGGKVIYLSGPTDAVGSMRALVLTGNVPGQNAYLVADPNLPGTTVFVEGVVPEVPTPYLSKNFFSPKAGEKLQVRTTEPRAVHLSVRVYNLAGELVKIVKEADVLPGLTVWEWDGRNESGAKVGNGTYFIQIVSGRDSQIKRVIVLDH